jgi:hypothetical protein
MMIRFCKLKGVIPNEKTSTMPLKKYSIGELWKDWFQYLNQTVFGRRGVVFLTDGEKKKTEKLFYVADMYDSNINLAKSVNRRAWNEMKQTFQESYQFIEKIVKL